MNDEKNVPLTLDEYAERTADTAIYPGAGTGSWEALSYVGLGLGEAGEIQGKIKKVIRDDGGIVTDAKRHDIVAEMGDAYWYLARLCAELGVSPSDVLRANLDKLASRKERGVITGSGDER